MTASPDNHSPAHRPAASTPARSPKLGSVIPVVYRLVLGHLVTKGRLAAVGGLSLLLFVAGFVVSRSSETVSPVNDGARLIANLGLAVVVPIVALLFASAALGDLREDKTLVYVWLTPVPKWVVPVVATVAAASVVVPAVVLPTALTAAIITTGGGLLWGTVLASALGALAYTGVFTMLGLVTRRTLVWGVAYILIWEGFVAGAGAGAARFALRAHTRSLLAEATDTTLRLGEISQTTALSVLIIVPLVAIAIAVRRYGTMVVD